MNKNESETLFASLLRRWATGDIDNFERDYAEDVQAEFNDQKLGLEDLKLRTTFFYEHYEILDSRIEDFIQEGNSLAVRLFLRIRRRSDEEIIEETFHFFYEVKDKQVSKWWGITNYSFGFPASQSF